MNAGRGRVAPLSLALMVLLLFASLSASVVFVLPAAGASSVLYGCSSDFDGSASSLYSVDPSTGAATLVGKMGITDCSGLFFIGAELYAVNDNASGLYQVDADTGAAAFVGPFGSQLYPRSYITSLATYNSTYALGVGTPDGSWYNIPSSGTVVNQGVARYYPVTCDVDGMGLVYGTLYKTATFCGSGYTGLWSIGDPNDGGAASYIGDQNSSLLCGGGQTGQAGIGSMVGISGSLYSALSCGVGSAFPPSSTYLITTDPATGNETIVGKTQLGLFGLAYGQASAPTSRTPPPSPCGLPGYPSCSASTTSVAVTNSPAPGPLPSRRLDLEVALLAVAAGTVTGIAIWSSVANRRRS